MKASISEKSKMVLDYLIDNEGENMTAQDICDALGWEKKSAVDGVVTSGLIGNKNNFRGFAERIPATIELEDGTSKDIKFIRVTEAGKAYDHDAAVAADAADAE